MAQLAESAPLIQAQRWFAKERQWMNEQHVALCRIPAPTFFEEKRAAWFAGQLRGFGWNASLDRAGNVLATLGEIKRQPQIAVTAHLDTVLAPQRPEDISVTPAGFMAQAFPTTGPAWPHCWRLRNCSARHPI